MLTKEDFRLNFRIISISSKLGIIPLQMDMENAKLRIPDSKLKKVLSWAYLSVFTLHATWIILRMSYLLLTGASLSLMSLLWHIMHLLAFPNMAFWHYTALFSQPDVTVTCFNKSFETWETKYEGKNL